MKHLGTNVKSGGPSVVSLKTQNSGYSPRQEEGHKRESIAEN